jgi:hypothetical protein
MSSVADCPTVIARSGVTRQSPLSRLGRLLRFPRNDTPGPRRSDTGIAEQSTKLRSGGVRLNCPINGFLNVQNHRGCSFYPHVGIILRYTLDQPTCSGGEEAPGRTSVSRVVMEIRISPVVSSDRVPHGGHGNREEYALQLSGRQGDQRSG